MLMRKLSPPSQDAIAAEKRRDAVCADDSKIDQITQHSKRIIHDNHLGPLIASLFRGENAK